MNRTYRITPVYTGDVSGVCSALYELEGMVVIHDPSGCNSTYNTHDETRWYDRDSLIFISALTEKDAIMGNDEKFVRDVTETALSLHPKFIALCSSPIPYLNGTDFEALARLIENRTEIPCFYVPANGMHDYTVGAGQALKRFAERFSKPLPKRKSSLNILGLTPLDYGVKADPEGFRAFAAEAGYEVVSCWSMGDGFAALQNASAAAVNLVVSSVGLPAAEYFYERFGTPYAVGAPVKGFRKTLIYALHDAEENGNRFPCRDSRVPSDGSVCAVGEPVIMGSLAAAWDVSARLICPVEGYKPLLLDTDIHADGEEAVENALRSAKTVLADPILSPLLSEGTRLIPLPHQALSGRNGWKTAVDLLDWQV